MNTQSDVFLHAIETAVPEYRYSRKQTIDFLKRVHSGDERIGRFIEKVAEASSISTRYSVVQDYGNEPGTYTFFPNNGDFRPEPGTRMRNDIFIRESERLSLLATERLLDSLPGFSRSSVTHLVTASCTGFGAPGFDLKLVKRLGLPPSVHRFHIGYMGCLAAFPVMKLASELCRANPGARVLAVNVELCTLHFQLSTDPDSLVANCLFADGASAALISAVPGDSSGSKFRLDRFVSRFIEDTEDDMTWIIGDTGFLMKLSRYVPQFIERNLAPILDELIISAGTHRDAIGLWAIHPGGRAILEKIERSLGLSREDLEPSYRVLDEYGNMSSATVMFVLKRLLENGKRGPFFTAAFGPGLTIEAGIGEVVG